MAGSSECSSIVSGCDISAVGEDTGLSLLRDLEPKPDRRFSIRLVLDAFFSSVIDDASLGACEGFLWLLLNDSRGVFGSVGERDLLLFLIDDIENRLRSLVRSTGKASADCVVRLRGRTGLGNSCSPV